MASARASTSRYSIDDWDQLAPLSPAQSQSVHRVSQLAQVKPVPQHLVAASSSRPSTPSSSALLRTAPRSRSRLDLAQLLTGSPSGSPRPGSARPPALPGVGEAATDSLPDPLFVLRGPISTAQQFHDWFSLVESSLERSQESVYVDHLSELVSHLETCDNVLVALDESRGLLSEMEANYRYVDENSRALQMACETMLEEQKHLIEVTEAIGARLEYFRELEKATRVLNLPGEEIVLKEDFLNMLDRLDVCLEYLKANRDFLDAEIYLIRFQQCLTRSMTLIKMYFVTTMRRIAAEAQEKMGGKELSETALNALLYAKFTSSAPTLRILLVELEKRASADPSEYASLLSECYSTYFASRSALLGPGLREEVRRMEPDKTELVRLAKMGCAYLRGVCATEWGLFREFFAMGENQVYAFLESLCDTLYDSLRPRILHEPRLSSLCELCAVLNAMMALDSSPTNPSPEDDDEGEGQAGMRFSILLQSLLQDAQTRLVFRAQAVIQSEVLHYVPSPSDLDWSDKLSTNTRSLGGLWEEHEEEGGGKGRFRVPREERMVEWYPTLRKTVWVLERLNAYVNDAIFQDFAAEAVTLCLRSLISASLLISSRPAASDTKTEDTEDRRTDGYLFLIRHLLLLKEMVRSVDLRHVERAADWSSVTEALSTLLRNTSTLFNPRALVDLASKGMPNFAETMTDAKSDLDLALKKACEELIAHLALTLTSEIRAFLDRCTAFLSQPSPSSSTNSRDLPAQPFSTPTEVLRLHESFASQIHQRAESVVGRIRTWLEEDKTVSVLVGPLWDEVGESYTTFHNLVRSEYGFETSSSLTSPDEILARVKAAGQGQGRLEEQAKEEQE
ncbi:Golgi transport complex subunit 3 [Rhodotorula toruloides]